MHGLLLHVETRAGMIFCFPQRTQRLRLADGLTSRTTNRTSALELWLYNLERICFFIVSSKLLAIKRGRGGKITQALSRFMYWHRKEGLRPLLNLEKRRCLPDVRCPVAGSGLVVTDRNLCSAVCTSLQTPPGRGLEGAWCYPRCTKSPATMSKNVDCCSGQRRRQVSHSGQVCESL